MQEHSFAGRRFIVKLHNEYLIFKLQKSKKGMIELTIIPFYI